MASAANVGVTTTFSATIQVTIRPTSTRVRLIQTSSKQTRATGLPTHIKDVPAVQTNADALMALIAQDKKVRRGKLTFILLRGIGQAFVASDVDPAEVRAFLAEKLN